MLAAGGHLIVLLGVLRATCPAAAAAVCWLLLLLVRYAAVLLRLLTAYSVCCWYLLVVLLQFIGFCSIQNLSNGTVVATAGAPIQSFVLVLKGKLTAFDSARSWPNAGSRRRGSVPNIEEEEEEVVGSTDEIGTLAAVSECGGWLVGAIGVCEWLLYEWLVCDRVRSCSVWLVVGWCASGCCDMYGV